MLYIKKNERCHLPSQFRPINNICAIIYDQLTEILADAAYQPLTKTKLALDRKNQKLVKEFVKGKLHPLDFLTANGLDSELSVVLTKHLTMSILSDFANFIYESLSCAKRGKFSVAYSLLRKPFTDELLLFEQLLSDNTDFISNFYHQGEPNQYDPSNKQLDKKRIIRSAIGKLESKWMFDAELIYKLRYDKAHGAGISGISNQAIHIVTLGKGYTTARQNLNFVFSGEDDFENYRRHYFYIVPYLLFYSVAVIDEIIFQFLPGENFKTLKAIKSFRRFIGLLFWQEAQGRSKKATNALIKDLQQILDFDCSDCGRSLKLTRSDYELFLETELLICKQCFMPILKTADSVEPIHKLIHVLNQTK